MSTTKVNPQMFTPGTQTPNSSLENNVVTSSKIVDNSIINADISPSAAIDRSKLSLPGNANEAFGAVSGFTEVDLSAAGTNAFNIGLLGFKMAVNEGLTIFNLVDGVIDEFNDESGIDTGENSNAAYDATSDFYSNTSTGAYPGSPYIVSDFTNPQNPSTYTAPPTATAVDLLVVGGGGGGSDGHPSYAGGGGGAGGLIFLENLPVTGGATYSVTVGEGGEGKGYPGSGVGEDGGDTTFVYSPSVNIIGEGGGAGGYTNGTQRPGGSGGGLANQPPVGTTGGTGTQATNHPVTGLSDSEGTPYPNSPPSFSAEGSEQVGSFGNTAVGPQGWGFGGGGAGSANFDEPHPQSGSGFGKGANGGEGLDYNIVDGSTAIGFAGGGSAGYPGGDVGYGGEGDEGGQTGGNHQGDGVANTGGGGGSGGIGEAGNGADGRVVVAVSQHTVSNTSMTLVSDTFTASTTPTTARIVVFGELPDGLSDFSVSATRDNTTFNNITLTDEGYQTGSSGIKVFSGSTPLTGTASPQVQVRWKIVGSSLTSENKIHGVSLQWK